MMHGEFAILVRCICNLWIEYARSSI